MFSGLKEHLRTAEDRLGGKSIGLGSGHASLDGGVRHGLQHHEHIGRRASADAGDRVKEPLRHDLEQPEGAADLLHPLHLLVGDLFTAAGRRHAGAHQCGRIGHQPDQVKGPVAECLSHPGDAASRHDADHHLVLCHHIPDLIQDHVEKLRLDREEKDPAVSGDLPVVICDFNAEALRGSLRAAPRLTGTDDIRRLCLSAAEEPSDHRAGHIADAYKAKCFHLTSHFRLAYYDLKGLSLLS